VPFLGEAAASHIASISLVLPSIVKVLPELVGPYTMTLQFWPSFKNE